MIVLGLINLIAHVDTKIRISHYSKYAGIT